MTVLEAPEAPEAPDGPAPSPGRREVRAARRRRWGWSQTLVMIVVVLGIGVLVYPSAASWLSARKHHTDVDGYVQTVGSLPPAEAAEFLAAARTYNENLPAGPLRDPYALGANGQQTAVGGGNEIYFKTLAVPGSDAMARVRIPAIGVDLPVFHGTDEETLARGVGHLFGSALPVGGTGTHAVLTGHSGFVQATLFDDLDQLVKGDTVVVTVLDEDLYYEVDQILTVLPEDTEALRQVPGEDHLTLVTCTPTGVNTHRLLVRGVRVDAPTQEQTRTVVADTTDSVGFPWWALILLAGPLAAFAAIRPRRPRPGAAAVRPKAAAVSRRRSPPS